MADLVPRSNRRPAPSQARPATRPPVPASVSEALRQYARPAGGDPDAQGATTTTMTTEDDATFWSRYQRVSVRIPDPPVGGIDVAWNGRAMPTYERAETAECAAGLYVDLPAGSGVLRLVPRDVGDDVIGRLSWPARGGLFDVPVPTPGATGEGACPTLPWQDGQFVIEEPATPAPAPEALVRVVGIPMPATVEIVGVGIVSIDESRLFRSPQGQQRFIFSAKGQRVEVDAFVPGEGVEVKWSVPDGKGPSAKEQLGEQGGPVAIPDEPPAPVQNDPPANENCGPLAVVPQGIEAPGTICAGSRLRDAAGREYVVVVRQVDGALVAEPVQPEGMSGAVKTLLVVALAAGAIAAVAWYLDRDKSGGSGGSSGDGDADGARSNPRRNARRRKRA